MSCPGFKYFSHFEPITTNVSGVLNGIRPGRTNNTDRILVYNYGIAIHDLVLAENIWEKAENQSVEYDYCREKYFI